jgi:tetratricopeptide (TPR) repeat protein
MSNDAPTHCNLGNALRDKNDVEGAVREYETALRLDPKCAHAHAGLGSALRDKNDMEGALREYRSALAIDPGRADVHYNLASALESTQDLGGAIREYSRAIELDDADADGWRGRSHVYAVLAQWGKAAADSAKAVQLNPDNDAWWWLELASYHVQAGNRSAYRSVCAQMLKRFERTENPIVAHRVALSCVLIARAVQNEKLVMKLAEQSARGAPDKVWCPITLGAALYRAGQFKSAMGHLERTLKRWPEDPYAAEGPGGAPLLSWLILAMAHHNLGHTENARRWLDKAVQRMDKEEAAKKPGALRQESHVWAMCLVLRREAQELVSKDNAR